MRAEDLQIGTIYYRCYASKGYLPVVDTWIYRGYNQQTCNSSSCDTAYYFYQFELYSANRDSPSIIGFPTKVEVEHRMKNWEVFLESANYLSKEIADLASPQ